MQARRFATYKKKLSPPNPDRAWVLVDTFATREEALASVKRAERAVKAGEAVAFTITATTVQ